MMFGIYSAHLKCYWDSFWIWHFWSENFLKSTKNGRSDSSV